MISCLDRLNRIKSKQLSPWISKGCCLMFSCPGTRLRDEDLSAAGLRGRHMGTSPVIDEKEGWSRGAELEVVTVGTVTAPTGAYEAGMAL